MPLIPERLSPPRPLPHTPAPRRAGSLREPGALRFASDRLPWQRSLRWGEPPRNRRRFWFGLGCALALTLLELAGFGVGMRSWHHRPVPAPQAIQVVLIDTAPLPIPPEPEPPQFAPRPSRIQVAPPQAKTPPPPPPRPAESSDGMQARIGSAGAPGAPPQLFNPDGTIRVGPAAPAVRAAAPKTEREAAIARWNEIAERGNPLDCRKTRFARAFAPDESAGDKVARKYLKWVGLADMQAIERRNRQRAEAGGCEPAQ